MQWNWIDVVILFVLGVSVLHGWRMGFVHIAGTLFSFLGSLWLAVRFNEVFGTFFNDKFGIPTLWGNIIGYIVIAVFAQFIISEIANFFVKKLPKKITESKFNGVVGAVVGFLDGLIVLAFFLIIFLILPIRGTIRLDIKDSRFGNRVVKLAEQYGGAATSSLDKATRDAVRFLTVSPGSRDRMSLNILPKESDLSIDAAGENAMFALVNSERVKANVPLLRRDDKLANVARNHGRDMFMQRYFSHVNRQGEDGADRMKKAGISFSWAGENLAYAAEVPVAHHGLMDSENHRRNILDPEFRKIGIGIIDAGIFGKMITQDFTN